MGKKLKPVDLPDYSHVPRWLVISGEIDHRLFILEQMVADERKKPPMDRMVDEATGFDKKLQADAQEIIAELRWLKKEYDAPDSDGGTTLPSEPPTSQQASPEPTRKEEMEALGISHVEALALAHLFDALYRASPDGPKARKEQG